MGLLDEFKDEALVRDLCERIATEAILSARQRLIQIMTDQIHSYVKSLLNTLTRIHDLEESEIPAYLNTILRKAKTNGGITLDEIKRHAVIGALQRHGGNKMRAAKELGINVKTLYNLMRRYDSGFEIGVVVKENKQE